MTTKTETAPRQKFAAAMEALGLTVAAVFVPWSASRNAKETSRSLNWRVTVQRNGRDVLTTDYMAGLAHAPAYSAPERTHGGPRSMMRAKALEIETETGFRALPLFANDFRASRDAINPDAVDVIWALSRDCDVLDAGGFEQWAHEYGYDADSRAAEAIYRACLDIALKLRGAIGEAGLEALRIAGEDF